MPDLEETKILLTWKSPSRPFKKRDRDFFTTIAAIVFLICVILLFIKEWLLILAILAFTFLVYVLNTVPPEEVEHQITNKGVITGSNNYDWQDFINFFFTEESGQKLLNINSKKRFYGRIIILLGNESGQKVKEILSKYLTFKEKPDVTFVDRAADWLNKKVPLEK